MSELGQALWAIRQRAITRGMPLSSVDAILDEGLSLTLRLEADGSSAQDSPPLDWPLSEEERQIWKELPAFRERHPVIVKTLEDANE